MPKVYVTDEQRKHARLDEAIRIGLARKNYTKGKMAELLDMNRATFFRKRRDPGQFKYEDLIRLSNILNFSDEEKAAIL